MTLTLEILKNPFFNYYNRTTSDNGQATLLNEPTTAGAEKLSSGDHVSDGAV